MTVNDLLLNENFKAVTLPDGEREISDVYIGDLLSWVMGRAKADDAWITIMSNVNILAVASLADTACSVLAEGVTVDERIKATATQKCINIISTDFSIFEAAVSINDML
jgi:predicted transcriptional regulator